MGPVDAAAQARGLAGRLREYDIQRVYVSPFLRCLQTAALVSEGLGVKPEHWTICTSIGEVKCVQNVCACVALSPALQTLETCARPL
jgi:broad specificity phosphatase PhoE